MYIVEVGKCYMWGRARPILASCTFQVRLIYFTPHYLSETDGRVNYNSVRSL